MSWEEAQEFVAEVLYSGREPRSDQFTWADLIADSKTTRIDDGALPSPLALVAKEAYHITHNYLVERRVAAATSHDPVETAYNKGRVEALRFGAMRAVFAWTGLRTALVDVETGKRGQMNLESLRGAFPLTGRSQNPASEPIASSTAASPQDS